MRHAPPETKTHIAFITAVIGVALVTSVWVVALPARFADAQKVQDATQAEDVAHNTATNETLTSVLKQFTASTTEAVKDLNAALKDPDAEGATTTSYEGTSTTTTASGTIIIKNKTQ